MSMSGRRRCARTVEVIFDAAVFNGVSGIVAAGGTRAQAEGLDLFVLNAV